jgi:glycine/D-amino acid oxidase-like deaminating enzyme
MIESLGWSPRNEEPVTQTADVVVIGSGGFGAATAYFLAKAGRRVALVDKFAISSQTSPRAAGLASTIRATDVMTRLASRAADLLVGFEDQTGRAIGAIRAGSVKIAREPEDLPVIERDEATGRRHGVNVRRIQPGEVSEWNPLLRGDGVLAALHIPTDVYFEPQQVAIAFAAEAAALGAQLIPMTPVTAIRFEPAGRLAGVDTLAGPIDAPIVVDAAGAWARQVARLAGFEMPLVPMRHQLFITEPLPGVRPEHAMFRFIDSAVYGRPCWGGLLLGGYEPQPVPIDMDAQPPTFEAGDVALDWAVLQDLADRVRGQLPILADAKVRLYRGGVPTLTVDGHHIVGPVPGVDGMFVAAGCNVSGLSMSPAIGEQLAVWITEGKPSEDLSIMAPDRFGSEWRDEARARAAAAQHYTTFYRSTI